jgi:hypothetical protein
MKRTYQVDMKMREMAVWDRDGLQRRLDVALPRLHAWQSLHQAVMSPPMPGHMNRELMSRFVARTPGWAKL